jgi:hypothetical protein
VYGIIAKAAMTMTATTTMSKLVWIMDPSSDEEVAVQQECNYNNITTTVVVNAENMDAVLAIQHAAAAQPLVWQTWNSSYNWQLPKLKNYTKYLKIRTTNNIEK